MSVLLTQFQSELGQSSHMVGVKSSRWKSSRVWTALVLKVGQEAFLHLQEACGVFMAACVYSTKQKPAPARNDVTIYFSEARVVFVMLVIISSNLESSCSALRFPLASSIPASHQAQYEKFVAKTNGKIIDFEWR